MLGVWRDSWRANKTDDTLKQKERGTVKKSNQDQAKLKDGIKDDVKQQLLQMKQNLAAETEKREEQKRQDLLRQQKEKEKIKASQSC